MGARSCAFQPWSFPVGLGLPNTFFVGPMPVRLGFEFNYFVAKPENFGARYLFKFYVVPVIPRLIKEPIFGR